MRTSNHELLRRTRRLVVGARKAKVRDKGDEGGKIYHKDKNGRYTNSDPKAETNNEDTIGTQDNSDEGDRVFHKDENGRYTNRDTKTGTNEDTMSTKETGKNDASKSITFKMTRVPLIEHDEAGNSKLFSCSAAVNSSLITDLTVEFDYQVYSRANPKNLTASVAILEGKLISYIAEVAGLPTSVEGDCPEFEEGDGPRRLMRRSLRRLADQTKILAVGTGDADVPDDVNVDCEFTADEINAIDAASPICTPYSGSVDVQIVGTNEMGIENFIKSSARSWMETDGNLAGVDEIVKLSFLGTRMPDPESGKDFVQPSTPAAVQAVTGSEKHVDDDEPTDLGIAFAFFLCLALALTLFSAARKLRNWKRGHLETEKEENFRRSSSFSIQTDQ